MMKRSFRFAKKNLEMLENRGHRKGESSKLHISFVSLFAVIKASENQSIQNDNSEQVLYSTTWVLEEWAGSQNTCL